MCAACDNRALVNGEEFIRGARRYARRRGLEFEIDYRQGKGSHATLYLAERRTTVKQSEIGRKVPVSLSGTSRTATDWLDLQLNALFIHDARGRMVERNALGGGRAPRFFLGRTPDGNRWRFRDDLADDLVVRLEALCADEPVAEDLRTPPRHDARYRAILAGHALLEETFAGPAYRFPPDLPPASAEVARLTAESAHLLRGNDLEPWLEDIGQSEPLVALVQEGRAVSICGSVRITPEAHEAGVEASVGARGRGFAVAVVAAWARAVRELGAEPLYSASWENTASQAVARKLGLIPYASDYWLR